MDKLQRRLEIPPADNSCNVALLRTTPNWEGTIGRGLKCGWKETLCVWERNGLAWLAHYQAFVAPVLHVFKAREEEGRLSWVIFPFIAWTLTDRRAQETTHPSKCWQLPWKAFELQNNFVRNWAMLTLRYVWGVIFRWWVSQVHGRLESLYPDTYKNCSIDGGKESIVSC